MESHSRPWIWIVESLLNMKGLQVRFINDVIARHVADLEEPHCRSLRDLVALRNVEEMIDTNSMDMGIIPLLRALTEQDSECATSAGSSTDTKQLLLRVRTKVVILALWVAVEDWVSYEHVLAGVFADADEDDLVMERKLELGVLIEPENRTEENANAIFEKYKDATLIDDLREFIAEKKASLKTLFLDQLARDFLDADGELFDAEELDEVEASTKVAEAGQQEDGDGDGTDPEEGRDEIPQGNVAAEDDVVTQRLSTGFAKKRLKRKLLPLQEEDEVEEGSAGAKKPRTAPSTSSDDPLQTLVRQDASESHENVSLEDADLSPEEPNRRKKYVVVPDVDSDAETQVAQSGDYEIFLDERGDGDLHNTERARSASENGSGPCYARNTEETESVRKETIVEQQRQRRRLVDKRKEPSTESPEVEVEAEDESIPLDSQDIYEVDFLDVGSDGHEMACHVCGDGGDLQCCNGCPISVHLVCLKGLGLSVPTVDGNWCCPVCTSREAAREAAEAEKAAVAAKEKLRAFKIESKKRRDSRKETAGKQSRLPAGSTQPKENDRALNPKQQSHESPNLRATEAQQGPSPSKASPSASPLSRSSRELNEQGEQDSERSLPEDKSPSNLLQDEDIPHKNASDGGRVPPPGNEPLVNARTQLLVTGARNAPAQGALAYSGRERIPGIRRIPLPWTREEEFVLKEGVKLYSRDGLWGFQWKLIKEFGKNTFDKSRTEVDLKDKWRNLVKGVS